MIDTLPDDGVVRKLWIGEVGLYRNHLLRLDAESRRARFGAGVSDALVTEHAEGAFGPGSLICGFLINGVLRGASELRRIGPPLSRSAEVAFSVEKPWQSHGVGSVLLERMLLAARNRGISALHMQCLADNRRMQQLAAKFRADLSFDTGSVIGEVDPPRPTPLSLMRELIEDGHGVARAILDVQSRLIGAA